MTFETLKSLIVETLGCEPGDVGMDTRLAEDLEADSLDAVEINMAIEEETGVAIPDEDMAELKTVGDILDYLDKR